MRVRLPSWEELHVWWLALPSTTRWFGGCIGLAVVAGVSGGALSQFHFYPII